jgi:DNA-binding response OmpR family regulator
VPAVSDPDPKLRVLLIGDSVVAAVLREYFLSAQDVEVESVEFCDDALALLKQLPFDVAVLLSLRASWRTWPSLSSPTSRVGSESAILFLKQLRALHNSVPVILASARLDAQKAALANGAAFLLKPFKPTELHEALRSITAARPPVELPRRA